MVKLSRSFIEHVGFVVFPRSPQDLTDPARCPACFTALPTSLVCGKCKLDLNHPDAGELLNRSLEASTALDARLELIGRIRFETEERRAAAAATPTPAVSAAAGSPADAGAATVSAPHPLSPPAPVIAVPSAPTPTAPAAAAAAASTPATATAGSTRSHAGIQVILLIVGVSLLSVGAIFFLIYAFLTFGLIWRSAIIASITIASIVGATTMKRRGLSATAEALSALAVVLVILDIFAIRANGLLVIGEDGLSYWGGALLIASLGFILWHRASNLRLVSVVGYALLPLAATLLAAGVTTASDAPGAATATMVALAAAALFHPTASHGTYRGTAERFILLTYGLLAFIAGLISAVIEQLDSGAREPSLWLLVLGVIAALHAVAAHLTKLSTGIRNALSALSGVLLSVAVWLLVVESARSSLTLESPPSTILVSVAALIALALGVETLGLRLSATVRSSTFWASIGVWAIAGMAAMAPLVQSLSVALEFAVSPYARRTTPGSAEFESFSTAWPQLALLVVPVALAIVWSGTRQLRSRSHLVLASAGVALTLSAPLTGSLTGAIIAWIVVAAAALAIVAVDRRRRGPHTIHLTLALAGLAPLVLAFSSGWASYETWLLTGITTAALLVAARFVVSATAGRAVLLGVAALVLITIAAGVGEQLQFALTDDRPQPLESWLTIALMSVVIIATALAPVGTGLHPRERRTLWWIGFSAALTTGVTLWLAARSGAPLFGPPLALNLPVVGLITAVALVALLSITMFSPTLRAYRVERIIAAIALTPATVWAFDSASRALGLGAIAVELSAVTASVLIGALSMVLRVRGSQPSVRRAAEFSTLAVGVIAALDSLAQQTPNHWLVTLLAAITLLLASVAADGVFGSVSLRRHVLWASVAFATTALWLRLGQARVDALEAYVLPVALVVLTIAVFTARAELKGTRAHSAPYIALAGLLIAIAPLSLNAASGTGLRTLVIAGLCGAALLIAAFVAPLPRLINFWGVTVVAAALGLVLSTASRALYMIDSNRGLLPELDSWLLGAVAVLALAGFGLASSSFAGDLATSRWAATSEVLLGTAIVLLYVVETLVFVNGPGQQEPLNSIRAIILVALGSVMLVLAWPRNRAPLTRRLSYLAFTLASLVGVIAVVNNVVRPIEWVTVTLGVGLLGYGALQLRHNPAARSLGRLSAGLLVILLPSLLATFVDTQNPDTQWRILALGIASVVAIVAGATLKLQAPLLIGTIVVLIHAAHTFAPALVRFYQLTDWWVWAVVGGAIVLFLGITIERRIRDVKVLNSRFSSLR